MKTSRIIKSFAIAACGLFFSAVLSAAEVDINGAFAGKGAMPDGWRANRPNLWDPEGSLKMNKVPDIEKVSVQITSVKKKMNLYSAKAIPVQKGNIVEIKGMVKGKGKGSFGVYMYPMGSANYKGFSATDEWTEFTAKLDITNGKVKEVRVVLAVGPGSSVEFMNISASVLDGSAAAEKK